MNEKKLVEINCLYEWAITILHYVLEISPEENQFFYMELDAINECAIKGKLSQLRMAVGDLNEMASGLSPMNLKELNRRLREKFGNDLCTIDKRMEKRMESVLKRGKIRNDDEYIRVSEWIDHLLWDPDKENQQSDIDTFERLLGEYVEKKSNKSNKH